MNAVPSRREGYWKPLNLRKKLCRNRIIGEYGMCLDTMPLKIGTWDQIIWNSVFLTPGGWSETSGFLLAYASGGARPIFIRWETIFLISFVSWMIAITFISAPQCGQIIGSISYTFASNLAQACFCVELSISFSWTFAQESSGWWSVSTDCLHFSGACSITPGSSFQIPRVRDAYKPYRRISWILFGGMCWVNSARKSRASNKW